MLNASGEGLTTQQQTTHLPPSPERVTWEKQPASTVAFFRDAIERKKQRENERDARRVNAGRRWDDGSAA